MAIRYLKVAGSIMSRRENPELLRLSSVTPGGAWDTKATPSLRSRSKRILRKPSPTRNENQMPYTVKIINGIPHHTYPDNPESKCPTCGTLTGLPIPPYDVPCQSCYENSMRESDKYGRTWETIDSAKGNTMNQLDWQNAAITSRPPQNEN